MEFNINTNSKEEIIDITSKIKEAVNTSDISHGIVVVGSMHTTAGITINENADPDVKEDILRGLSIFNRDDYQHGEGNSSAHIKASLIGSSVSVIISDGKLKLGTWQGIMFCEFDGPRNREFSVKIIPD